jgi:carnitine O-acetyltransferase
LATSLKLSAKGIKTFAYQENLPKLPVPSLDDTCNRYLKSVQPFSNSIEYEKTRHIVKEFLQSKTGEQLQNWLLERAAKTSTSWLEEWWNHLAYLDVRDPILINVNYGYGLKDDPTIEHMKQSKRAALLIDGLLKFRELIESETLELDRAKSTPLCMVQYKYLFGTCRVPEKTRDRMETATSSKALHIIVARHGQFYVLDVINEHGLSLPVNLIER